MLLMRVPLNLGSTPSDVGFLLKWGALLSIRISRAGVELETMVSPKNPPKTMTETNSILRACPGSIVRRNKLNNYFIINFCNL